MKVRLWGEIQCIVSSGEFDSLIPRWDGGGGGLGQ